MDQREKPGQSPRTRHIYYLLRLYSMNYNTYQIDFAELAAFVGRYLTQENQPEVIREYARDTQQQLRDDLEQLSAEQGCQLQRLEGDILTIYFPRFFLDRIAKAYKQLEADLEQPFPREEILGITIPQHLVRVVNIKTDFIEMMKTLVSENRRIIRLLFPDQVFPLLITSELVSHKLLEYAVQKIKLYLEKKKNSSYIENKLYPVFRQQGRSLREMINSISVRTGQVITGLREASDFTFHFWAHFTNLVLQEYRSKTELLPQEHDFCQAAYLINYCNIYYKSLQQQEMERQAALRHFERKIKKTPYVYTLADIYNFTDTNGYLLLKKYSREFISGILARKIQADDPASLPEVIRFITSHGQEYYIHQSAVMVYCLTNILEVSRELRKHYINQWIELLREHKKLPVMTEEIAFIQDLNEQIQLSYPILAALLNNYYLLYLANEAYPPRGTSTAHIFDRTSRSLQPMNILLGLDRQEMLEEARSYLPFWQTIPVIQWIIGFFRRLFLGRRQSANREKEQIASRVNARYGSSGPSPAGAGRPDPFPPHAENAGAGIGTDPTLVPKLRANYKKALGVLKTHFVGRNETISSKLEFLAEKWNPLYDPVAKANLVEDVNAMIRDFLRSLKRGFRVKPPTISRIETLAATLVKNKHFDEIEQKQYLKQYIEVFMVKELGENRF